MRLAVYLLSLSILALAWFVAAPARACTTPWCQGLLSVHPVDGATDVPLNIQLRVRYDLSVDRERVSLETQAGESVALAWEEGPSSDYWLVGHPILPLLPATRYFIKHGYDADCRDPLDECALCPSDTSSSIGTFITGTASDTVSPAPAAFGKVKVGEAWGERADYPGSCGRLLVCSWTAEGQPIEPGTKLWIYRDGVYAGESDDAALLGYVEGPGSQGDAPWLRTAADVEGFGSLTVRVVDASGNLSKPVALEVPECEWPESFFDEPGPDAGGPNDSSDAPDGGMGSAGGPTETSENAPRSNSGCSVGASGDGNVAGLASLCLLLLGYVRPRRHSTIR